VDSRNLASRTGKRRPGPDDPAVKARQAGREEFAAARAKVRSAREAAKASGTASLKRPLPLPQPSSCAKRKRSPHGK
jgi:hypothetical protein